MADADGGSATKEGEAAGLVEAAQLAVVSRRMQVKMRGQLVKEGEIPVMVPAENVLFAAQAGAIVANSTVMTPAMAPDAGAR